MTHGIITRINRDDDDADYTPLLARYPDHAIERDARGTLRWKADPLMVWIVDRYTPLNKMWEQSSDQFPLESLKKFYRDIGYSLAGYLEVFPEDGEEL